MSESQTFTPRKLKRPPVKGLEDSCVAMLGHALEVQLSRVVLRYDMREAPLFWYPDEMSLFWIDAACSKLKKRSVAENRTLQAKIDYEEWTDKKATKWEEWTCSISKNASWYSCGNAFRFDYKSNKWGKMEEYTHGLGKKVKLYFLGRELMRSGLWLLRGGDLRVTSRGIEG